jgi:class 3 adenylate cyclase
MVDDEEGVRRSVKRALQKEGYALFFAENGHQAIDIVKEKLSGIAIVLSDLKMPGLSGLETLIQIGNLNPEITRILLTGYATMESAIQATNEGIDGFLTKPFENVELRAKIWEYFTKKQLEQFVSTQILKEIQTDPKKMRPKKQRATILFTDIRGFSSLSEKKDPQELADFLSLYYFTPLGDIVFKYNGTLDKHIGDSIMVIYGGPISYGNDTERAVFSALDMQERMRNINKDLIGKNQSIPVGIGIATGEVVTGIFGSWRKKEYTAFGSPVNIAAYLQGIAGEGQILITEDTYREIHGSVRVEKLNLVQVKGIKNPIQIYNVTGLR